MCSNIVGKRFLTRSLVTKYEFYLDNFSEFIPQDTQKLINKKIDERKQMIDNILAERNFNQDLFEYILHKKVLPPSDKAYLLSEKTPKEMGQFLKL